MEAGQFDLAKTHMREAVNLKATALGYPPPMESDEEIDLYHDHRGFPSFSLRLGGPSTRVQIASVAIQAIVAEISMTEQRQRTRDLGRKFISIHQFKTFD
jgi:hypothetical protein